MKPNQNRLLAIAALFTWLLAATTMFAQEPPRGPHPTPEQRARHITEKMVKGLELNEKQAQTVQEINLRYARKIDETRRDPNASRTQKFDLIEELFRQKDNELQGVLTKEQFSRFKVKQDEKLNHLRGKMKQRAQNALPPEQRAHNQAEKMQQRLNLTPEQQQKAEQINLKYARQAEELRNRQNDEDRQRARKFAELRDQREQELKTLLTDEQKKKLDELKQQRLNQPRPRGGGGPGNKGQQCQPNGPGNSKPRNNAGPNRGKW